MAWRYVGTPWLERLVSHKVKSTESLPMTAWLGFSKGVSCKTGNNSVLPAFLCIVPFVLRNPWEQHRLISKAFGRITSFCVENQQPVELKEHLWRWLNWCLFVAPASNFSAWNTWKMHTQSMLLIMRTQKWIHTKLFNIAKVFSISMCIYSVQHI